MIVGKYTSRVAVIGEGGPNEQPPPRDISRVRHS